MSDYFLNKIYDSLLSKKPVPKKPIVEKKEVKKVKTLTESYQIIKERSKASIVKDIINVAPELKPGTGKKGEIRLQPVQKEPFPQKDLIAALELIGLNLEKVARPREIDSQSSRYPTYIVKDKDGTTHYIVVGGGAYSNKGMEFERRMAVDLENNLSNQNNYPFYQQFKKIVGPVTFIKVESDFTQTVRRKLTGKPNNIGHMISDATLTDNNGQKYFLSLKNVDGKTISNNGLGSMFEIQNNKITVNPSPLVDPLLQAVHMDKYKIADLVEKYRDKVLSGQKGGETVTDYNADIIYNYLGSAIDYGYYYVRETKPNIYYIAPILTLDDLKKFIGEIQTVLIKYPFYAGEGGQQKRKNASIIVQTTNHTFSFDLRNAAAGLLPVQINLVKLK